MSATTTSVTTKRRLVPAETKAKSPTSASPATNGGKPSKASKSKSPVAKGAPAALPTAEAPAASRNKSPTDRVIPPPRFGTVTRPPKAHPAKGELPFTLADIRQAIPAELFSFSWGRSIYHIAMDLFKLVVLATAQYYLMNFLVPTPEAMKSTLTAAGWSTGAVEAGATAWTVLRLFMWVAYTVIAGSVSFGLWVIGHECGHQAYFGKHEIVNDVVGFILHSMQLAPFFSWKFTHATHHRFTNLKSKDTAFVPTKNPGMWWGIGEWFPPIHALLIFTYWVIGWWGYISFNYEGHKTAGLTSHFSPFSPLFTKAQRPFVLLSGVGFGLALAAAYAAAQVYGGWNVFSLYGLIIMGNYGWLVTVTFLQHTDQRVPHYDDDEGWNFVKGALACVDRTYGWGLDETMHHITNHHILHHLFSTVPFYNAKKMTPYVEKLCGKYYLTDNRFLLKQLWESWWVHQSSHLHEK